MSFAWAVQLFMADFRAGRHTGLLVCFIFALFSMISLQWLSSALKSTLQSQTHQVLAADAVLKGYHPLTDRQRALLNRSDTFASDTVTTPTVVFKGERTLLVSLKAVDARYPLKAEGLHTSLKGDARGAPTVGGPGAGEAWVESAVLFRLGLKRGDTLSVGHTSFTITRIVRFEADRSARLYALAPRIMISMDDLPATGILHPASRVIYKTLVIGQKDALTQLKGWLEPELDEHQSFKSPTETRPAIQRALDRVESFLLVTGLIAAMLALTSMCLVMDRYVKRSEETVAMLRCSGASRSQLLQLYSMHGLFLLLMGWVLALLLALLTYIAVTVALDRFWGITLEEGGYAPVVAATLGTLFITAGLLYYKLDRLLSVPAIAAIKGLTDHSVSEQRLGEPFQGAPAGAEKQAALPVHGMSAGMSAGVLASVLGRVRQNAFSVIALCTGFVIYCLPAVGSGSGVGWLAVLLSALLLIGLGYLLAYGVMAAVDRYSTRLPMVGQLAFAQWRSLKSLNLFQSTLFGIIIACFMLVIVLKEDMFNRWKQQLPPETPNYFISNLFEEQRSDLEVLLRDSGVKHSFFYPIVRGRLIEHNGERLRARVSKERRQVSQLERELSLTWREALPEENVIEQGRWWQPGDYGQALVSVELSLAETLGINVGDRLMFSFAGEEVEVEGASLRSLDWDTFKPSFYMIFAPGFLDDYEPVYMASLYIPTRAHVHDAEKVAAAISARFPQATLFSIDYLLQQVRTMVDYVGRALYIALAYLVLATFLVLGAALLTSWDERVRSGMILRTLGASRAFLRKWMLFEYAFLGLAVVVVGVVIVEVAAALLALTLFSMPIGLHPWVWGALLLFAVLFFCVIGLLTQKRALS